MEMPSYMAIPSTIDVLLGKRKLRLSTNKMILPRENIIAELRSVLEEGNQDRIKSYLKANGFGDVDFSQKEHNKTQLWLLGEQHDHGELISRQIELIAALEPEIVIHEFLRNCQYDPQASRITKQDPLRPPNKGMHLREDLRVISGIIHICNQTRSSIVGCDLTDAECDEIMRTKLSDIFNCEEVMGELFFTRKSNGKEVVMSGMEDEMLPIRDDNMCKAIIEQMSNTRRPVVAILGGAHSVPIHEQKRLEGKGFDYAHIKLVPRLLQKT